MKYKYVVDEEGVKEAHAYLKRKIHLGVDTETTGLDPLSDKMHCLQIGDEYRQFIFDFTRTRKYIRPILDILEDSRIVKIAHNSKFDYKFIRRCYGVSMGNLKCTMLAERIINNGWKNRKSSLEACVNKYMYDKLEKDVRASFIGHPYGAVLTDVQIEYGAKDVELLIPLLKKQYEVLKRKKLTDVYALECAAVMPTAEMELNGVFLDRVMWKKVYHTFLEESEDYKEKLDKIFAPHCDKDLWGNLDINYNSGKQAIPVLQTITGIKLPNYQGGTINSYANKHPVFDLLSKYKKALNLVNKYGLSFTELPHKFTGRVHATYNPFGTDTGRFSCNDPNLQQIPAKPVYRECFHPMDVKKTVMYTADYSGCELRILAELSGDKAFRAIFRDDGADAHKAVASIITGIPVEDITPAQRKQFKAINFGVPYGMGPAALGKNLGISTKEAKVLLKQYFQAFPGIKEFLDKCEADCLETKLIVSTLDGRIRDASGIDWDNPKQVSGAVNAAKNMPFQGGNGSIIKRAMIILYDKIKEYNRHDLKLVACVHDELVVEGDLDKKEEGLKIVMDSMVEAGEYYIKSIPMTVDIDVGDHWIKG
jgi:DNA polymerase I-like protein with 3'-5' exonuclease and polymerase domains